MGNGLARPIRQQYRNGVALVAYGVLRSMRNEQPQTLAFFAEWRYNDCALNSDNTIIGVRIELEA